MFLKALLMINGGVLTLPSFVNPLSPLPALKLPLLLYAPAVVVAPVAVLNIPVAVLSKPSALPMDF